jgi:hypothetical protein
LYTLFAASNARSSRKLAPNAADSLIALAHLARVTLNTPVLVCRAEREHAQRLEVLESSHGSL